MSEQRDTARQRLVTLGLQLGFMAACPDEAVQFAERAKAMTEEEAEAMLASLQRSLGALPPSPPSIFYLFRLQTVAKPNGEAE